MHSQKPIDEEYFKQIYETICDHASRITIVNRYVKSEIAQLKSDINQNVKLAVDNDSRLK